MMSDTVIALFEIVLPGLCLFIGFVWGNWDGQGYQARKRLQSCADEQLRAMRRRP